MKLSIIIVNYNVKYFLEQALYSIRRASVRINPEVFVVDNNSVDGSIEMLMDKFSEVILIKNDNNVGFSRANNQAIRVAKGEYILLLNPDTVIQEDTLDKVVDFMDQHPDAGGLGVKMLDGKGKFLPESKRGLPTPMVAFYKVFGFAKLFPFSKTFGKYHLGYLDKNLTHEVDVLSGAFMLMRQSTLAKAGLLDEDFFMYGEDIDLSYRIQLAGYKNFYFADTQIIHYKGESTKKSSVNYVFVFYNAMIIFASKHFSKRNATLFTFLINVAIYLRAGVAIASQFIRRIAMPVADFLVLFAGMYLLKIYWEQNHKYVREPYDINFITVAVPMYISIWLFTVFLSGGYDKPIRLKKIVRGVFIGTITIAVIYAFVNEEWRFSRALIVLGAFWAVIGMVSLRLFLNFIRSKAFEIDYFVSKKNIIIVAEAGEGDRILKLLEHVQLDTSFIGFVDPGKQFRTVDEIYLGNIVQLKEILEVYKINEVIFSTKSTSVQEIIDWMSRINDSLIDYKIAPEESMFIIGSNSVDNPGDLYTIDFNLAITKIANKRNKRLLDIIVSLVLLISFPVSLFLITNKSGYFKNCFDTLIGKKTWVGYINNLFDVRNFPKIKKGVLNPVDGLSFSNINESTAKKLNTIYAKQYQVENDIRIIIKGFKNLGRS